MIHHKYTRRFLLTLTLTLTLITTPPSFAQQSPKPQSFESTLRALVTQNKVLGLQVFVGQGSKTILQFNAGVRSATDSTPINDQTMFCIGSCSKPFTSAAIMTLIQDKKLTLDTPIDNLLPQFAKPSVVNSPSKTTAPTLRQLLAHRAGIYSQKRGMTPHQATFIRDFKLTIDQSVNGIAKEKLLAKPGAEYAYSGAGYMIVGKLAEAATHTPFNTLMQNRIAKPLNLTRTSYFPSQSDPNIATGSLNNQPNPATPHLSQPFNLPLIGGSLYSTGADVSRFAQMILNKGAFNKKRILTTSSLKALTSLHFPGQPYSLGWTLNIQNKTTRQMSHNGSLASSRAAIRIDLQNQRYAIVLYTLTNPTHAQQAGQTIGQAINALLPISP